MRQATSDSTDGDTAQATAVATIVRITGRIFRLTQIERVIVLNALPEVTPEVVDETPEALLIGH
ncbi:hypothetical protein [Lacisediminihabitans profunda]|uniref:Uncharacterized protein n=1 Tax=Lacisediminihabitans profunda TaxID=2594790 RepID=A0A5C8UKU2_9MICO|nr:hypothetical protein [Lacisediminihabitans profunda]TXN28895.1 hypothetical protein FVP33_15325 [Lacisediminihabitans profunda]